MNPAIAAERRGWDVSVGPVLLVAGESPAEAFIILPDSASATAQALAIPRTASVTLFGRGGSVQTAELQSAPDTVGCRAWPLAAAPPPRGWSVGFIGGVVAPIAMDSVESMAHADSASLAAEMTALASALPNDSLGRFTGLPFTVRSLWRFSTPSGSHVVIATLVRQINQEASAQEERTFLIAEHTDGDSLPLTTRYSERSYGPEETVESREVLAATTLGDARKVSIIVSRDYGNGSAISFISRSPDGRWRTSWTSARRHC